jgi:hypothetical protein
VSTRTNFCRHGHVKTCLQVIACPRGKSRGMGSSARLPWIDGQNGRPDGNFCPKSSFLTSLIATNLIFPCLYHLHAHLEIFFTWYKKVNDMENLLEKKIEISIYTHGIMLLQNVSWTYNIFEYNGFQVFEVLKMYINNVTSKAYMT